DATAFPGPDATTLARADPTTCAGSDATTGSWSAGGRPGNSQWVTEVGYVEIGKRVELRYHDGGLHSQYGIHVHNLRRGRRELFVGGPRQCALGCGDHFATPTTTTTA